MEGHIKDPALIAAVAELRHFTTSVHILGSFPRHSARQHVNTRYATHGFLPPAFAANAIGDLNGCGGDRTLNPNEELLAAGGDNVAEPPPPSHRSSTTPTTSGLGRSGGGTPGSNLGAAFAAAGEGGDGAGSAERNFAQPVGSPMGSPQGPPKRRKSEA